MLREKSRLYKNKEIFIGYDQGKKISLIGSGYVVKDHSEEYARRKIFVSKGVNIRDKESNQKIKRLPAATSLKEETVFSSRT